MSELSLEEKLRLFYHGHIRTAGTRKKTILLWKLGGRELGKGEDLNMRRVDSIKEATAVGLQDMSRTYEGAGQ